VRIRIREWRQKRGLSLRRLADEAGVHWMTIHRIEQGNISPTVAMLEKLAKALDIGPRDFFPATKSSRSRRSKR
jgi:transcriptional regulator with XRE-family HTH domain